MNKKIFLVSILVAGLLLAACSTTSAETTTPEAATTEAALTLSGAAEASWSVDDLKAMNQTSVDYTDKDGNTTTYSGVLISDLLSAANVASYTKLTLIASDGSSVEVTADELSASTNSIVAINDDGTLSVVMPDLANTQFVAGLVEISVSAE